MYCWPRVRCWVICISEFKESVTFVRQGRELSMAEIARYPVIALLSDSALRPSNAKAAAERLTLLFVIFWQKTGRWAHCGAKFRVFLAINRETNNPARSTILWGFRSSIPLFRFFTRFWAVSMLIKFRSSLLLGGLYAAKTQRLLV